MLGFHELTLKDRAKVAEDAVALTLRVPDHLRSDFHYLAGQHVAVRATVGGKALRRTYSIVAAKAGELTIGVRVQGEMSRYLAEALQPGQRLEVMSPGGSFHPHQDTQCARFYVAMAAGSGITPILSIAASVLEARTDNQMLLLYANRNLARTMFVEEVLALKNRYPTRFAVHFLMSQEPQDIELYNGRLDAEKFAALSKGLFDPKQVDEYFLCGPGAMVETLSQTLQTHGVAGKIHIERFGALRRGVSQAEAPSLQPLHSDRAEVTEVTVLMDGRRRSFNMPTNAGSILEAAERAGIELPFACRAGVCSSCRAKVVNGEASMAYNQALEDWELAAGYVLCCQARPLTASIEIDYDHR